MIVNSNLEEKLPLLKCDVSFFCFSARRNLFPCNENGSDSYVRLYLLPDQTWRHRKKTHVKKRTVNPIFNDK